MSKNRSDTTFRRYTCSVIDVDRLFVVFVQNLVDFRLDVRREIAQFQSYLGNVATTVHMCLVEDVFIRQDGRVACVFFVAQLDLFRIDVVGGTK